MMLEILCMAILLLTSVTLYGSYIRPKRINSNN